MVERLLSRKLAVQPDVARPRNPPSIVGNAELSKALKWSILATSKGINIMRISESALATSEPLFEQFVECMRVIRDFHCEAFAKRKQKDLHSETLRVLNHYQQDRTQAAYCLIVNGLVWDAEVVIRVAYETFAKVAFLATASEEQRAELLHEYWELLGAVYDRQTALKAMASEHLLDRFGGHGGSRMMAALRDGSVYRTDPLGDKRFRKQLEQRWSFSEILEALKSGRLGNAPLSGIEALAHIYSMSSHFAHANSRALDLLEDRATRVSDLIQLGREPINGAHRDVASHWVSEPMTRASARSP
ncbi:hypothetical protein [Sphingomonas sp. ID0503]|uniref:hypothetical protein n=1 Tax=Sphingomonas sp. ID0503 TaxID=3399691 RepID=UPI003AFB1AAA